MDRKRLQEDEVPLPHEDYAQSTSSRAQPIETALRAAGIYLKRDQIPSSSDVNRRPPQDRYHREREARKSAVYYGHHEYDNPVSDDEAAADGNGRYDMSSNRYQTQGYQGEPNVNSSFCNDVVVAQPLHPTVPNYRKNEIPDYTALSVIVILFCFPPVGICALINSRDVHTVLAQGNRTEALRVSRLARNLNIAGFIIGPVIVVTVVLLKKYVYPFTMM